MIILYCSVSSRTSRQAMAWFKAHHIPITKKRAEKITRADIVHILSLSENGFSDILKKATGTGTRIHRITQYLEVSNFEQALDCIMENKDILKVPLIFDQKKLVIGYHSERIRVFLPQDYRKSERE